MKDKIQQQKSPQPLGFLKGGVDPAEVIERLKRGGHQSQRPDLERARRAYDLREHEVNDPVRRPDKRIVMDLEGGRPPRGAYLDIDPETGEQIAVRIDRVNRIALPLQELITDRSVSFLFGNPAIYTSTPDGEQEGALYRQITQWLEGARSHTVNIRAARTLLSSCQVAELWYLSEGGTAHGGAPRMRVRLFSPALGDRLYPYYDDGGDLVAFSREYTRRDDGGDAVSVFETYTATETYLWHDGRLSDGYPRPNPIGKIPVVYAQIDRHETALVDGLISRLEYMLSNFADVNDYHAAPKMFVKGRVLGFVSKGESGGIIEGEEGSEARYLSWDNAPEAVRLEMDRLWESILTLTQTPDISFSSLKGIGAQSGVALRLLFMDAHLKAKRYEAEIFGEYLSRRVNILKAFALYLDPSLRGAEALVIRPELTPYNVESEREDLDYWMTASGGRPLISREEAVRSVGLSQDVERTLELITREEQMQNALAFGNYTDIIDTDTTQRETNEH